MLLNTSGPRLASCRGDASFVIPEIFNRESRSFKCCGPRLEDCRGDGLEGKIHRGFPILLFRFLIEPFRNDTPSVIPEIFYRESKFFLWFLNTYGPRLEDCRGDEEVGIQRLLPLNNLDS